MKVGDFVVERLHAWGVRRIYGYPGDGINGVLGALQRARRTIEFIQVRHEEMAAFMAVAHAKFTGELGVCLATGGPGATHLITGLYDAQAGPHAGARDLRPGEAHRARRQLPAGTRPGPHVQGRRRLSCRRRQSPAQVRHLIDRAMRVAIAQQRRRVLILPNDLQDEEYEEPRRRTASRARASATPGQGRSRAMPICEARRRS